MKENEPAEALFGGADGMDIPRQFITAASRILKSEGFLAIEHHENQAVAIEGALGEDFIDIVLHRDLTGRPRFTTARKK